MAVPQTAYNTLMGMFRQQQAPAGASVMEQAQADARNQMLGRLGFGLLAAAIPQTAAQRTQALQQAFGGMGDMNTAVYNNAQARLMAKELEAKEAAMRSDQDFLQNFVKGSIGATVAPTAPIVPTVAVAPSNDFRAPAIVPAMPPISADDFRAPSPAAQRIIAPPPPSAIPPAQRMPVQQQFDQYGLLPEQKQRILNLVQEGVIKNADELRSEIKKESMSNLEPQKPLSKIGQLNYDLDRGAITPEEYAQERLTLMADLMSPLGKLANDPYLKDKPDVRARLEREYIRQQEAEGKLPVQILMEDTDFKKNNPIEWNRAFDNAVGGRDKSKEVQEIKGTDGKILYYQWVDKDGNVKIQTVPTDPISAQNAKINENRVIAATNRYYQAGGGRDQANSAVAILANSQEAKEALKGGIFSGPASAVREKMARYGSFFSVGEEALENTATFKAAVKNNAVDILRGFGGSDSDFEFRQAQIIAGSDTELTDAELLKLVELGERLAIRKYNEQRRYALQDMALPAEEVDKILPPLESIFPAYSPANESAVEKALRKYGTNQGNQ